MLIKNINEHANSHFLGQAKAQASKQLSAAGYISSAIVLSPLAMVGAIGVLAAKTHQLWQDYQRFESLKPSEPLPQASHSSCLSSQMTEEAAATHLTQHLAEKTAVITQAEERIERTKETLIAACLTLVPFFGIMAAASYLKGTQAQPTRPGGVEGAAEAFAQKLLSGMKTFARAFFYPLGNDNLLLSMMQTQKPYEMDEEVWQKDYMGAYTETISVERGQGKQTELTLYRLDSFPRSQRTVILFHGNYEYPRGMIDKAVFYRNEGFNVVMASMGGYPTNAQDGVETDEASTYQDVSAIINHLKMEEVPYSATSGEKREFAVHGFSIGGSLAFAAAELFPDDVKGVIAERTFSSGCDAAANLMTNTSPLIPAALARAAAHVALPEGKQVYGVKTSQNTPYLTDGLNNARKAAAIKDKVPVFVIQGTRDEFMGQNPTKNAEGQTVFQSGLGDQLIQANTAESEKQKARTLSLDVNHVDPLIRADDLQNFKRIEDARAFLRKALEVAFPTWVEEQNLPMEEGTL